TNRVFPQPSSVGPQAHLPGVSVGRANFARPAPRAALRAAACREDRPSGPRPPRRRTGEKWAPGETKTVADGAPESAGALGIRFRERCENLMVRPTGVRSAHPVEFLLKGPFVCAAIEFVLLLASLLLGPFDNAFGFGFGALNDLLGLRR